MGIVDYQIGASADDGFDQLEYEYYVDGQVQIGYEEDIQFVGYLRFPSVTIPIGASITASYISYYYKGKSGTPPSSRIYFEDSTNSAAITDHASIASRVKTTNYVTQSLPSTGTWANSGSLNSIIQELVDSGNYSAGAAMLVIWIPYGGSGTNSAELYDYSSNSARAAKLHIEYTEAASGKPAANVIWIG